MTLLSDPEGADYRRHVTIPFGKQLDLSAPFSFALEATDFVRAAPDRRVSWSLRRTSRPGGRVGALRGPAEERPGSTRQGGG